jgi:hypothetical protein
VRDEQRGLSPQDQEKLGAHMAEVFAKAREAEEFENLKRVECPIRLRATPQPSTGRRSVRSKSQPEEQAAGHSRDHPPAPETVRAQPTALACPSSFRAICARARD